MKAKISRCEELCEQNPEYPLVLLCSIDEGGMSFNLRYNIKIDNGPVGEIRGTVEFISMSSITNLDDEDADIYCKEAERMSIDFLVEYLKKDFPEAKVSGTIKSTSHSLYDWQKKYVIET